MKFLIFFLYLTSIISIESSNEIPTFTSFPTSPISNYSQQSLLFLLKCSSPLYLYLNNSLTPFSSLNQQQFDEWYNINKPISVTYTSSRKSNIPQFLLFNQFDISLSIITPMEELEFIVQVSDNYFFNVDGTTIPYSSPLIITRASNTYNLQELVYNRLSVYKYPQKNIKSWDEKQIDIDYKDSSVQYINGLPFLQIKLVITDSGTGEIKLQPNINADGYEYKLDELSISITKKDPVYQIPIKFIDTINLFQEDTSRAIIIPSSRDEFFADVIKIKASKYICNEEPTLFQNMVYLDVVALENKNNYLLYQLRPIENIDVIAIEYIWKKEIGWQRIYYNLNEGYGCRFLDKRNQFCQFCNGVNHMLKKTNMSYFIFNTDGKGSLLDYGLSIDVYDKSSFYFKNQDENYLGNSQSSLKLSFESYILIPDSSELDSSYYLWLSDITIGCKGISISSSDYFYEGSCNLNQYSCSNIHYFREPQNQTLFINENYNYLFSNKRSGIRYMDNDKLYIEIPQPQIDVSISLYVPSLPFQQPFIKELLFKYNETTSFIFIYYSFLNYGAKSGDFNVQIDCTDSNNFFISGTITANSTQDLEFSYPKSIVKTINYECVAKVVLKNQKFWSTTDKEIISSINFTVKPTEIIKQCDQDYSNLINVSRKSFRSQNNQITLLFTIQNQIDSIDMFRLNVNCSGNLARSKIIQISTGDFINVPILIQEPSNSKCQLYIESYQMDCKYSLYKNEWDYINNSNSSKVTNLLAIVLALVLLLN